MKRILLFILILAIQLFPQLKELEVKPTENRGGIPIFRDHPDKAGIIFYTQFDDLKFYSSYGIVEIKGDPAGGKYVVIIEAVPRQTIEVRAPGFKTEMIRLESLQPRDVFYYEVLPKKQEGIEGIPELGVTINATPTDAKIFIDGESVVNLKTKKIKVGSHRLRIEREGFATSDELVEVSPENTFFPIELRPDAASTMVKVEGGTFMMGSNDRDAYDSEKPVHRVTVSSFLIGKYEVTQVLWESVMGNNPSNFKGPNRPVESVSWYEMVEFCNKLSEKEGLQKAYSGSGENIRCDFTSNGYRLPTEAEWEYAARGGNKSRGYKYSGSNDLDAVGWYDNNSGSATKEVGTKQPNELGIYDMIGNVWEWCWDWKGEYSSMPQENPSGPTFGSDRINRGGSWRDEATDCLATSRQSHNPEFADNSGGLRVVRKK